MEAIDLIEFTENGKFFMMQSISLKAEVQAANKQYGLHFGVLSNFGSCFAKFSMKRRVRGSGHLSVLVFVFLGSTVTNYRLKKPKSRRIALTIHPNNKQKGVVS